MSFAEPLSSSLYSTIPTSSCWMSLKPDYFCFVDDTNVIEAAPTTDHFGDSILRAIQGAISASDTWNRRQTGVERNCIFGHPSESWFPSPGTTPSRRSVVDWGFHRCWGGSRRTLLAQLVSDAFTSSGKRCRGAIDHLCGMEWDSRGGSPTPVPVASYLLTDGKVVGKLH